MSIEREITNAIDSNAVADIIQGREGGNRQKIIQQP